MLIYLDAKMIILGREGLEEWLPNPGVYPVFSLKGGN